MKYDHKSIEQKWQERWEKDKRYAVSIENAKNPFYNLVMFPYPSGFALHLGHWYNYSGVDVYGRFLRLTGHDVFQPMGYDAFGLPAENFAIKTGTPPKESIATNTKTMEKQIRAMGGIFQWDQQINTSLPEYYRWTQWIFLQMYKRGLAEKRKAPVNWCSGCNTVLANEQVLSGACERCSTVVEQRDLEQWFWKITEYSERLLAGLDTLDWPEKTKHLQKQWIGKSNGAKITFAVENSDACIEVFTTRPDTLFGASYMVLSPEHHLVEHLTTSEQKDAVRIYQEEARLKNEITRLDLTREKTGVFTGAYAINPINDTKIPVWIADYVLVSYGTGAIMAVPAHDERDWEFAKKFDLSILEVITSPHTVQEQAYTGEGILCNSGKYNGLKKTEGGREIIAELEQQKKGCLTTTYRLKDWLISRQRYWGAPIPVVYCKDCGIVPVPENELPVRLPEKLTNYKPEGKAPLAEVEDFVTTTCPTCGKKATRETDTMDTFVCSSWYWLRYLDPQNADAPFPSSQEVLKKWLPVDMYIGGIEHACMHLLYARFVNMMLFDSGFVPNEEPFARLRHQGLITKDGAKMSKSKGNVVNPDAFVEKYGADVFRAYLLFMGPFEEGGDFSDRGIIGVKRFLDKVWLFCTEPISTGEEIPVNQLHKAIAGTKDDYANLRFNTALAKMMECMNVYTGKKVADHKGFCKALLILLAPLTPHITEELWENLGFAGSVHEQTWPEYDPSLLTATSYQLVIQVNGKMRATIEVTKGTVQSEVEKIALAHEKTQQFLEGREPKKIIYVPEKLVNVVG